MDLPPHDGQTPRNVHLAQLDFDGRESSGTSATLAHQVVLADSADAGGHRALLWYNRIENTEAVALHKKDYCAGHTKGQLRVGARQAYHQAAARSPRNTRPVELHGSNVAPRQAAHAAPVAERHTPEALGGQAHNAELLHAVAVQLDCARAVVHGNGARVE